MNLFLVKKAFFDMWDNLLAVFIINIGFVAILGGALYLPTLLGFNVAIQLVGVAIGISGFFLYTGAVSVAVRNMVDYQPTGFREFFSYFGQTWKQSLVMSGFMIVQVFVLTIALPFYLSTGRVVGVGAASVIFWASVIWLLTSQSYFPALMRLDTSPRKVIRKIFMLFFDNTPFFIVLGIGSLAILAMSLFTALMLPGFTAILIWHHAGLKLRLLKYDYLEENPDENRKQIPWDALLIDERDRVGVRTFRGMIFPWKE